MVVIKVNNRDGKQSSDGMAFLKNVVSATPSTQGVDINRAVQAGGLTMTPGMRSKAVLSGQINPNANTVGANTAQAPSISRVQVPNQGVTNTGEGLVAGYRIKDGWRAADPEHVSKVTQIYNQLNQTVKDAASLQREIDRVAALNKDKGQPKVTGEQIWRIANEQGVDPLILAAIVRQDTQYGITAINNNLSNIGTYDGKVNDFPTIEDGLRRTAQFLASIRA